MGLVGGDGFAVDGSLIRAMNSRDRRSRAPDARRRAEIEASVARYEQLDTADRQEPSEALATKTTGLRAKIAKLGDEMRRLAGPGADARQTRSAGLADRSRCALDGDERPRLRRGRLQRQVEVETDAPDRQARGDHVGSHRSSSPHGEGSEGRSPSERLVPSPIAATSTARRSWLRARDRPVTVSDESTRRDGRSASRTSPTISNEDVYGCPAGETLRPRAHCRRRPDATRYWTRRLPSSPANAHACHQGTRSARCTSLFEAGQRRLEAEPAGQRQRREEGRDPFAHDQGACLHLLMSAAAARARWRCTSSPKSHARPEHRGSRR